MRKFTVVDILMLQKDRMLYHICTQHSLVGTFQCFSSFSHRLVHWVQSSRGVPHLASEGNWQLTS